MCVLGPEVYSLSPQHLKAFLHRGSESGRSFMPFPEASVPFLLHATMEGGSLLSLAFSTIFPTNTQ